MTLLRHFRIFVFPISRWRRPKHGEIVAKTRWAVCDRKKFTKLIDKVKSFIDGLQDITKPISTVARQEGMMRFGVQQIEDTDTLQILSDVCENDFFDIFDAASIKLDVLTIATTRRDEIEAWVDEVDILDSRIIGDQLPLPPPYRGTRNDGIPANINLNAIVVEYLEKWGYTDTVAIMRAETSLLNPYPANPALTLKRKNEHESPTESQLSTAGSASSSRHLRSNREDGPMNKRQRG
jgi:hypothetical protein